MDPTVTLVMFLHALNEVRTDDALVHWNDLIRWIRNGGFRPTVTDDTLAELERMFVNICEAVIRNHKGVNGESKFDSVASVSGVIKIDSP